MHNPFDRSAVSDCRLVLPAALSAGRWERALRASRTVLAAGTFAVAGPLVPVSPAAAAAPPVADIVAGHRANPSTGWLDNVKSCNRFVSKTGDDTTGTSHATAWRTLAKAMRQLQPGQTACVRAGTYDEAPMAAAASGTATNPIAIRAYPGEKPLVRAVADGSLFDFQRSGADLGYWLLQGLTIDKQQHDGATVRIEGDRLAAGDATLVHHVVVRGNTLKNGKSAGAVLVRNRVTNVLIRDNVISDHHRFVLIRNYGSANAKLEGVDYTDTLRKSIDPQPDGSVLYYGRDDAHGISIESDTRYRTGPSVERVRVQGNRLLRNGGDGLQCMGSRDGSGAEDPSDAADIDLVDNTMADNVEEAVDIKSCQRVSIRGSVSPARADVLNAANNRFLTSKPTDRSRDLRRSDSSGNFGGGGLITLHWNARHVRIENTRLSDACEGIAVGRAEVPVRHLVVRRVLVSGMVPKADARCASDSDTGSALRLDRVENADIYHNTFDMQADAKRPAVGIGNGLWVPPTERSKGPFLAGVDFWNNIVQARSWVGLALRVYDPALDTDPAGVLWASNGNSDRNLYFRPGSASTHPGLVLSLPPTYRFDPLPLARTTTPPNPADPNWRDATGLDTTSRTIRPDFVVDYPTRDYYTQPSSWARDKALPIAGYGVPACPGSTTTNHPDVGFRETCDPVPTSGRPSFTSYRDAISRSAP